MVDGVLDQGLDEELQDPVAVEFGVEGDLVVELVLVPDLLDRQVALDVLELVPDGDDLAPPVDPEAEELRQGARHVDGLIAFAQLHEPDDGIEGVVEEVGIDLGLEGAELELPLHLLLPGVLADQIPDLLDGDVAVPGEVRDLVVRVDGDVDVEVAAFHLLHRPPQRLDGPGDPERGEVGHDGGEDEADEGEHQVVVLDLVDRAQELVDVGNGDDRPSRGGRIGDGVEEVPTVDPRRDVALPLREDLRDPLAFQVSVDELLAGMVDDLPRLVDDEDVARFAELDVSAEPVDDVVVEVDLDDPEAPPGHGVGDPPGQGDDPGVAVVHQVLHVRGGDRGSRAESDVEPAVFLPEVHVRVERAVRRRRDDVPRRGDEEDGVDVLPHRPHRGEEEGYPGFRGGGGPAGILHGGPHVVVVHDDEGEVVHVGDVVLDDPIQLDDEFHRRTLGVLDQGRLEIGERKRPEHGDREEDDHGEGPYQVALDRPELHFPSAPFPARLELRYSDGVMPTLLRKIELK